MGKSFLFTVSALFAASLAPLVAQTTSVPFTLTVQQGTSVSPISNGQTLAVSASGVGQSVSFTIAGTSTAATAISFSGASQILGSPDFTVTKFTPTIPGSINPGQSFSATITYVPSSTATSVAQLTIPFSIAPATTSGTATSGSMSFSLSGATANFTVNYYSSPNNNITAIANGGTIAFPSTLVNTSSTISIVIANAGTSSGTVNGVTLTGTNNAFQLQGLGLLPSGVLSGGAMTFNVLYFPSIVGSDTGTLTIQLPTGPYVVNFTGTAVSATLAYQMTVGTTNTTITSAKTVTLPDTNVASTTSVTIQVQNTGTASSTISSISTTGSAYSLTDLPVLPVSIAPNSSISFTLNFTPATAASAIAGTMTIGSTRFNLSGNGLGQALSYSYAAGSNTATGVAAGGTILFPSEPIAQSTSVTVTVTSTGTLPTTVTSIGIVPSTASGAFALSNLPTLPATLQPNAALTFTVTFSPVLSGLNSATMLVNSTSLILSGFGTSIPTLPSYQITGASGAVQPSTQPTIGLTLSAGYALDITGVLTMSVNSSVFAADPAVLYATGGRTISFTIPANTTQAVFSTGAKTVQFQTGTVAESIVFSPTFTAGGVSITPTNPTTLTLTVPSLAPTLLTVQIASQTSTSITLLVEGYSTTRSLSKLNFTFSSLSPTFNFSTTTFSLDVSQSAGFWYSTSGSQLYGGEFAITYPFSIQVPTGSTLTLANNIAVSVTATNSIGTSNAMSAQ